MGSDIPVPITPNTAPQVTPGYPPAPHHTTHEPGGSDIITSLLLGDPVHGTIVDENLPAMCDFRPSSGGDSQNIRVMEHYTTVVDYLGLRIGFFNHYGIIEMNAAGPTNPFGLVMYSGGPSTLFFIRPGTNAVPVLGWVFNRNAGSFEPEQDNLLDLGAVGARIRAGHIKAFQSGSIQANSLPFVITIIGMTNTTPPIATAIGHGLNTFDIIGISGVTGLTNANGIRRVTRLTADTFSLQDLTGADIVGNGAFGGTPIVTTGIAAAERVVVGAGTNTNPPFAFAATPGTGLMLGAAGRIYVTNSGTYAGQIGNQISAISDTGIITLRAANNTILTSPAAATWQLGAADAASPVAQTLQAQGSRPGTDVNIGGGNNQLNSGKGTGTGTVSKLALGTPNITGAGSGAQSIVDRITLKQNHINISLADVPIYANNAAAVAGGLVSGDLYRSGGDPDAAFIVH